MNKDVQAITVTALEKRFGSFRAVKAVNFSVGKGEIYGFLGANGAGKSTTIKMLCGLLEPDGGTALVAGVDVGNNPEEVKRRIGYMCQKFALYEELSAAENLKFFGGIYGLAPERLKKRIAAVCDELSLNEVKDTPAGSLPRGFQQRLALGCAIIHEPEIIFLDEPTAGVDPIQRRAFWDLIYDFSSRGTTIFVTTHFLDEAEFCHRISFIVGGDIVAEDTPAGLKNLLSAQALYEIETDDVDTALKLCRAEGSVQKAAVFGDGLHVSVPADQESQRSFASFIAASGIGRAERVTPTLEDVFLYLAGRKE